MSVSISLQPATWLIWVNSNISRKPEMLGHQFSDPARVQCWAIWGWFPLWFQHSEVTRIAFTLWPGSRGRAFRGRCHWHGSMTPGHLKLCLMDGIVVKSLICGLTYFDGFTNVGLSIYIYGFIYLNLHIFIRFIFVDLPIYGFIMIYLDGIWWSYGIWDAKKMDVHFWIRY